jgi:ubiquinone/menaquinone biosynthesis C-methylase UbiE
LIKPNLPAGARILVAGCGLGHEALHIHKTLGAPVTGFDVELHHDTGMEESEDFKLMVASVLDLPFEDASFDAVFYHHVIEHVPDAAKSLEELARVLKPGGLLYVGTPNRHRLVAYVGSYDANFLQKIGWNLKDYWARIRGKFRNELGAHAGFSEKELDRMLRKWFSHVDWLTQDYLNFKYGAKWPKAMLKTITWRPICEIAAPAIYALARK